MEHGIEIEKLIADTSSGAAANKSFGYAAVMEMREIEDRLKAEGVEGPRLIFAVSRAYEEAHKHDLTFSQRQDLAKWLGLPWAGGARVAQGGWLSAEELAYLDERLEGVNDPVGQAILKKVQTARKKLVLPP